MNRPRDEAIALELPQLLGEHLLGNFGYRALQFREAHDRSGVEVEKDAQLPPAFNRPQRIFGSARRGVWRGRGLATGKGPYFFVRTCHEETIIAKRAIVERCVPSAGVEIWLIRCAQFEEEIQIWRIMFQESTNEQRDINHSLSR